MKVAELSEQLAKRNESRFIAKLGDFRIEDDASMLTIKGGEDTPDRRVLLDEKALLVLAKFTKVLTARYLNECPPDFRAQTLRYWLGQKPQSQVLMESVDHDLVGMYDSGIRMIPVARIAQMVENVFSPEDEVRMLLRDEDKFHLDVTSEQFKVDVPNPHRIPGRPEVGDITCGGIRFLATPNKVKAPTVSRFFHRLICTNGMTTPVSDGKINIKGLSVSEIIASMEEAAQQLLSDMDEHLNTYRDTAQLAVPGHPVSFAEQLGHEMNIPQRQLHVVLDRVRQLPQEQATVYDVNQAFTSVANEVRNYSDRTRLQTLGGELAFNAPRMIERCGTCEHLLVER